MRAVLFLAMVACGFMAGYGVHLWIWLAGAIFLAYFRGVTKAARTMATDDFRDLPDDEFKLKRREVNIRTALSVVVILVACGIGKLVS